MYYFKDGKEQHEDGNYDALLKLAGAKVLAYGEFGDYQGTWIAKVKYNGKTGWVSSYYGSCSGCDSLESLSCYDSDIKHFIKLAKEYLETITTKRELRKKFKSGWDVEEDKILQFIDEN